MAFGLPDEGTRRLRLVLGSVAGAACVLAFAVTLILHGPPYWAGWWVIMLGVLVGAIYGAREAAAAVEWIIAGYRKPG